MHLYYSFVWHAEIFPMRFFVIDDGGSFSFLIPDGAYAHVSVAGDNVSTFAERLEAYLNASSSGAGSYVVSYSPSSGYEISYSGGAFQLYFTGSEERENARRVLGFPASGSGASQSSIARPWFSIYPAIQARSKVSDEYEPEDIATEAVSDSGHAYIVSVEQSTLLFDWTQPAETNEAPENPWEPGTPVHRRFATAAVPFTYQHAWAHMRLCGDEVNGSLPFYVSENGSHRLHWLRAEGLPFHPMRFAADDYDLWNIEFLTRTLPTP